MVLSIQFFLDKKALKESIHYTCIAAINIDSVMEMNKKKLSSNLFGRM